MISWSRLGRAAVPAVLLLAVSCRAGDHFEPDPGATVEADQLGPMIAAAVEPLGLTEVTRVPLPMEGDTGATCNQQGLDCRVAGPPGLDVIYRGEDVSLLVEVLIGFDADEASETLDSHSLGIESESTGTLQRLATPVIQGTTVLGGPCDRKASFDQPEACAYEHRSGPDAGDRVASYTTGAGGVGRASVLLTRGFLFARIEVSAEEREGARDFADKVAIALDSEMKQALSQ